MQLFEKEREAVIAADFGGGEGPTEVLGGLENSVPVEGRHVEGREELYVLLFPVPGFGIDGERGEEGVVAEGGEELEVGWRGHGGYGQWESFEVLVQGEAGNV